MTDRTAWTYISGHVNALAERRLDQRTLLSVAQAASVEEQRTRLRLSLLFADTPPGVSPLDEVEERFEDLVRRIAHQGPDPRIADLLLMGRRWEAYRAFARSRLLKKGSAVSPVTSREEEAAEEHFETALRGEATMPGMEPFAGAGRKASGEMPREGDVAGWLDRIMDAYEAAALLQAAQSFGSQMLTDWVRTWVLLRGGLAMVRARLNGWDAAAILNAWREAGVDHPALEGLASGDAAAWPTALRELGLPKAQEVLAGGQSVVALAKAIDDRMTELTSQSRGVAFGPEVVFAFLWTMRMEAVNLRLVLSAANAGIPEQRIAPELRAEHG